MMGEWGRIGMCDKLDTRRGCINKPRIDIIK
jgi:hypothetical protein